MRKWPGRHAPLLLPFIGVAIFSSVAFSLPSRRARIGLLLAGDEKGGGSEVEAFTAELGRGADVLSASGGGDVDRQAATAAGLLRQGIDALVIRPINEETAAPIVRAARGRGVKVIAYDRFIQDADVDLYVAFDHYQAGGLEVALAARKISGRKGIIFLLGEESGRATREMIQGARAALAKSGGVPVIESRYHPGGSAAMALATAELALAGWPGQIGAFLATNDAMALAVAKAVEAKGLKGAIFVAGSGGGREALQSVEAGSLSMTIRERPEDLARSAAKAALALVRGGAAAWPEQIVEGARAIPVLRVPVSMVLSPGR